MTPENNSHLATGCPDTVEGPGAFDLPLCAIPAREHLVLGYLRHGAVNLLEEGLRATLLNAQTRGSSSSRGDNFINKSGGTARNMRSSITQQR